MGSYEYHSHVADVRMVLTAQNFEELLLEGLKGMSNMMKNDGCHQNEKYSVSVDLKLDAIDPAALLVDFLSEVLTISHTDRILFCTMRNATVSDTYLSSQVLGKKINGFDDDIKAVTHHEARVWQTSHGVWKASLIFDI